MVIACPCILGYYWYTNFKEPVLLIIAAFLLVFGLFSRTIIIYPETEKKIKVFFFCFFSLFFSIFAISKIGGEGLGGINYWPVACLILVVIFYKSRKYIKTFW